MGAGSTSGKYVYLNSSISKNSMNNYTMTVSISTSSTEVFNEYGVKIYAHLNSEKILLDTITISAGVPSKETLTHTFSISADTSCYSSSICSYCESGEHDEFKDNFINQTSPDTATYENPGAWVNTSSGFVKGQTKVWNGSSWTQGYTKVWNGSAWVNPK